MEWRSPAVRSRPEFLSRFCSAEKEERISPRSFSSGDLSAIERKITQEKIKDNENHYMRRFWKNYYYRITQKRVLGEDLVNYLRGCLVLFNVGRVPELFRDPGCWFEKKER